MKKPNNKRRKKKFQINFKYNLKEFWRFLRKYKFSFSFVIFLVLIHELKQVSDKFLFKVIIDNGALFIAEEITRTAFRNILLVVAAIFLILMIINVFNNWLQIHIVNRLENKMMVDMKRKYFNHLVGLDHDFHVTHKTGSLISRLKRGSNAMEGMVDILVFNFAPLIIQVIVAIAAIVYFEWVPAVVLFITMIVFITFNVYMQKKQEESRVIANKTEDIEKGNVGDIFTNIDSIKYFGKERFIKNKYKKLSNNTKESFLRNWDYHRWLSAGQSFILSLGTFFLMLFPLISFLNGEISVGTLTFIYTVYWGLVGPMFGFVHGIRHYYRVMADFQELFEYGKIKKSIKDKPGAQAIKIRKGEIEFNNVDFAYGKRKIFKNFNLRIPEDKKIALVGHSGCGKTTLVKILYRMYDIQGGEILIDGQDIKEVKQESLREEMSIVPQECVLFDDTIYNNVAFSNPKATKQEVLQAMKFAQLDKIIKDFPKKEKTIVGERGVKLSGGEKQRVSIARAILADKKILMLDEATSALDSETEHEIQKDLTKLMQGRTSIIIAHRLSTIMHADTIVVMQKGKIVQMGTHNELIRQPGEYKKLWSLQKGGYIK